jgi:hypothetical protein
VFYVLLANYPPEARCGGEWERKHHGVERLFTMRQQHLSLVPESLYDQEQRRASSGVHLVGRHQQDANWQHASCVSTKMRDNY